MTTRTALTLADVTSPYTPTVVLAQGSHTDLALELNAAMAASWGARHLYLATYGVAWSPLPTPGREAPALTLSPVTRAGIAPVSNASCLLALTPPTRVAYDPDDAVRTLVR